MTTCVLNEAMCQTFSWPRAESEQAFFFFKCLTIALKALLDSHVKLTEHLASAFIL